MKKVLSILWLSVIFTFTVPAFTLAQNPPNTNSNPPNTTPLPAGNGGTNVTINLADLNPLNCPGKNDVDLQCVVERIVDVVSKLAIPIVAAMVLWGGMKIIMAGGNPKSAQEGRQIIYNAAIGFAIVLVANSVVLVIKSLLGAS